MVRIRRNPCTNLSVGLQDFTDHDMARMRDLVAEGLHAGWVPHPWWEKELDVLHHIRGRRRGISRLLWQLDPYGYEVDDAVAEEIRHSRPGSLQSRLSKRCQYCEGMIHGALHVVGSRYAVGCP